MQRMKTRSTSRRKQRIPISWLKYFYWINVYPDPFKPDTYEVEIKIYPWDLKNLEEKLRTLGASEHDIYSILLNLTGDLMDVLREKYGHLIRWMKYLPKNGDERVYVRFVQGFAKTRDKKQVEKMIREAINKALARIWEKWRQYFKRR